MSFLSDISLSLHLLESSDLKRHPLVVSSSQDAEILIDGCSYISLCSNNYLGLANHPSISNAMVSAVREYGVGSGSSRLISGTMLLHRLAENRLSQFLGFERSLLFSSGYSANVGTIQSLVGPSDVIFSDSLNHASIIDGCRLSGASVYIYHHCDVDHLHSLLSDHRSQGQRSLVISEAVFSMDGDIAPLKDIRHLSSLYDSGFYVDEAHSIGVFGHHGRGLCSELQIEPDVFIGTLGKAFGVCGAFVSGSSDLILFVENQARSFIFSTASPPSLASSIIASIDLVESSDDLRSRLHHLSFSLRNSLKNLGYRVLPGHSPIIPVLVGSAKSVIYFSNLLLDRGIFVHGIRPPTVPVGTSRLRIIPSASLTDLQFERTIQAFISLFPSYSLLS